MVVFRLARVEAVGAAGAVAGDVVFPFGKTPHVHTVPLALSATLCRNPAAIATTPLVARGGTSAWP